MTAITENLNCNNILIHGEQTIPEYLDGSYQDERLHFTGNKKILRLESSFVNNGQNECLFRHICEDICHYVFISVQNVPDGSNRAICEVIFD